MRSAQCIHLECCQETFEYRGRITDKYRDLSRVLPVRTQRNAAPRRCRCVKGGSFFALSGNQAIRMPGSERSLLIQSFQVSQLGKLTHFRFVSKAISIQNTCVCTRKRALTHDLLAPRETPVACKVSKG